MLTTFGLTSWVDWLPLLLIRLFSNRAHHADNHSPVVRIVAAVD